MDQVYIVGAGGFGREVAHWLTQSPDCGTKWRLAGFLDGQVQRGQQAYAVVAAAGHQQVLVTGQGHELAVHRDQLQGGQT